MCSNHDSMIFTKFANTTKYCEEHDSYEYSFKMIVGILLWIVPNTADTVNTAKYGEYGQGFPLSPATRLARFPPKGTLAKVNTIRYFSSLMLMKRPRVNSACTVADLVMTSS